MDAAVRHRKLVQAHAAAHVDGLRRTAPESIDVGHGLAGRGRTGWWINVCVGLGIDGPANLDDIRRITAFYHERGKPAKIDLCDAADPALVKLLGSAGYRAEAFETVLAADLPADLPRPVAKVEEIDASDVDELSAAIVAMERGFADDATFELPAIELVEWRHVLTRRGTRTFVVRLDATIVATGSMLMPSARPGLPAVGMLFGGSVLPRYRRAGLHRDLMLARLQAAADSGCDASFVEGIPTGPTHRTARRLGLTPLCTLTSFERPLPR
jgi:hypothetical protein